MRRLPLMVLFCAACAACAPTAPASAPQQTPAGAREREGEGRAHAASTPATGHAHGPDGFHKDFSDAAAFAAHFDDPARDAWQKPAEVIEHLRIAPGSVVVDLGAGTGYFMAALSERVGPAGKVLALDVEPEMVEHLARRARSQQLGNVEPRLVTGGDPGLAPGSASRILIVNTWHHIDDRATYARRLATALAPGGEIWVVDFTPESALGPPPQHRLAASQVVAELAAGGLQAEIVEPEGLPEQYLVRAMSRP